MIRNFLIYWFVLFILVGCSDEQPIDIGFEPYSPPELIHVYNITLNNLSVVSIGSKELFLGTAFEGVFNGQILHFSALQADWPFVMKDQFDRKWTIFGQSEDGSQLTKINASFGYWFAWSSIFPGIELFGEGSINVGIEPIGNADWDVPEKYVFKGANFDVFESLVYPKFITYDAKDDIKNGFFLSEDDPVIVLQDGDNVKVYPHKILYYHEIVNDSLNGEQIAVIFSPFTATSTVWNRNINRRIETFGSSGMIYNNNILPFDRQTESIWSQLLAKCVNGVKRGTDPELYPYFETKWATIKAIYEQPLVLSPNTGFDFDYEEFPFEDYRTNNEYLYSPDLLFDDNRLKRKEIVFGVSLGNDAIVYEIEDFD